MKIFQTLIIGISIMSIPFFNSCGNNDPDPCNWSTEVQDELDALTDASNAFGADPTNTAKCNAYKDAFQDYLNALEDHDNCVPANQQAEYDQAIDNAQASINALQC